MHDTVEDTDTTVKDIEKIWGKEVARLVDSLTKIQRLKLSKIQSEEFEAEDHRKILIGMAKDIRVILVKLADRLHNLRTLSSLKEENDGYMLLSIDDNQEWEAVQQAIQENDDLENDIPEGPVM